MIAAVADRLGPDLLHEVVLVGGCTTGLLLTDQIALGDVRHTDDVDLIVHVVGKAGWYDLQRRLVERGFRPIEPDEEDDFPICAMRCGDLRVDFMPDDETILGFSNRWYGAALRTAIVRPVGVHELRLVSPPYFVATKLEAYRGRGRGDPLGSRDVEDILVLFLGRDSLVHELSMMDPGLRSYLTESIAALTSEPDFAYAVQSVCNGDRLRYGQVMSRMKAVADGSFNVQA
jgi:hypothetical protein